MKTGIWAAVAILAFAAGGYFWNSDRSPDRDSAISAPMVSVKLASLNDKQMQGEAAFAANCAQCHGENAAGKDGFGPPLIHKIYEPSHHGDGSFFLAVAQGVRAHHWTFGNMPPVADVDPQDVARIVLYIRKLQETNGIH